MEGDREGRGEYKKGELRDWPERILSEEAGMVWAKVCEREDRRQVSGGALK